MGRFVQSLCGVVAGIVGSAVVLAASPAEAQEIQITGPLAGAPAVRQLRLRREGRFEFAPGVSFTLLDEYRRTIMPGARLTYHLTDWFGFGAWGGFGFQYSTALTDELQEKAIDNRRCTQNPFAKACRLTEVNLTRGNMAEDQLGAIQWIAAPQLTFVPFRGKLSLFASLFVDTDVNFFVGPAFVGLKERADCGDTGVSCSDPESFALESRLAVAPTFGLGLNFYPANFLGFGVEWRGLPFSWNTSGFDNRGFGEDEEFPDNKVDDKDREFRFNSMLTVSISVQFPTTPKLSD